MSFAAPALLAFLAAVVVPLAAHLMRRRDLITRPLPTIALLQRAQEKSRRRFRLVDLLLLMLRVALVAAAAVALARPFWLRRLAFGDGRVGAVGLVLDDSMSVAGRPALYQAMQRRALEAIDALPPGSEVVVVLAGEPPRVAEPRTDNLGAAKDVVRRPPSSDGRGTNLERALELAARQLAGARHAARRMLVLSDFAAHAPLDVARTPEAVETTFERLGPATPPPNVAVTDLSLQGSTAHPGEVEARVELNAYGLDGTRLPLALRRGGVEVHREEVEVVSGHAEVRARIPADERHPIVDAWVEFDDALPADNRRAAVRQAGAGARVWVVDGRIREGSARFLNRAMDLLGAPPGPFEREVIDPDTFATRELSAVDVVVFSDVPAPAPEVAARLHDFVRRGGGLLIAAGEQVDARAYRAAFDAFLPATLRPASSGATGGPSPVGDWLPLRPSGLESTRTRRRFLVEARGLTSRAETVMRFADDAPAMLLSRPDHGRVALLLTSLDESWSDFPYRPGFLPWVARTMQWLRPVRGAGSLPLAPGAVARLRAPPGARRLLVRRPDGQTETFAGPSLTDEVVFADTAATGGYLVEVTTRSAGRSPLPMLSFSIAPPAGESDLTPGDMPTTEHGVQARAQTVRVPLANWFFLLVGLLALLEIGVRSEWPRRRSWFRPMRHGSRAG